MVHLAARIGWWQTVFGDTEPRTRRPENDVTGTKAIVGKVEKLNVETEGRFPELYLSRTEETREGEAQII